MEIPQSERRAFVQTVPCPYACFGQVTYLAGGNFGPRTQADYQLVIIHSGSGEVTIDGQCHAIPVGRAVLFKPGHREHFRFSATGPTHHSWCSIAPSALPAGLARRLSRAPFTLKRAAVSLVPSAVFERLLSTGLSMASAPGERGGDVLTHLAITLFAEFIHMAETAEPGSGHARPAGLQRALGYMEAHFGEGDCLARAFAHSGVSRSALIRYFAEQAGLSPGRYLWRLRTERGVAMLGKTGLTVSEIAYQCGFQTPFHFSRLVKQQQGCSPRELRKRLWNSEA